MSLNIKNLPHDGYTEREVSDAINQIIQFSVQDISASFIATVSELGAGEVIILDSNVNPDSKIGVQSRDVNAVTSAIFVSSISDGSFGITSTGSPIATAAWDYVVS